MPAKYNQSRTINKSIVFILLSVFLFFSCNNDDEAAKIAKERKQFQNELDDIRLTAYRAVKILVRSTPVESVNNPSEIENIKNSAKYKLNDEIKSFLTLLLKGISGDSVSRSKTFSVTEIISIFRGLYSLKSQLKNINEDDFPTILEIIVKLTKNLKNNENILFEDIKWNPTKEHLFIAFALEAVKGLPTSFKLYEISLIKSEKIENNELKPVSEIFKAIAFIEQEWHFLADEALTKSIEYIEQNNLKIEYPIEFKTEKGFKISGQADELSLLRAISYGIRGFNRLCIDSKKKNSVAVNDFEIFVKESEKLGIDNEFSWFANAFIHLKKNDEKQAEIFLNKIKNSQNIEIKEKKLIEETIKYLAERNSEKALQKFKDALFITKLIGKYFVNCMSEIDWHKKLLKTDAGRQIIAVPNKINEQYQKVKSKISIFLI